MKKNIKSFVLVLSALIALTCFSCASASKKDQVLDPVVIDKVERQVGGITLTTGPAYEVTMLLLRLAEYPAAVHPFYGNSNFNIAVDTWFQKFKSHKSVKLFENLTKKKNVSLDDFLSLANIMKDDLTGFTRNPEFIPYTVNGVWATEDAYAVLKAMNEFAHDTKFDKFYILHRADYISMQNGFVSVLEDGTIQKFISEMFLSGKELNMKIHTSELLAGEATFYGTGNGDAGYDYIMCYAPYVSKDYYFGVTRFLSKAVVNPFLQYVDQSKFDKLEESVNTLRVNNGVEKLKDPNDIKYLVLEDIVSLNGFVCLRENDKKEDYEYFRNEYKQLVNENFPDKVEGLLNNYLSIEPAERNFQAFMKTVEMNILLEMYETFAGRVK
ncbi:MAG: DUF4932 domain-containing protein [Treponema sp.]|nr:DUF4932 domain-containing protein [Treponema sp.]